MQDKEAESNTLLANLNEQQREVVLTTDKPTLVIAGAGSGKTTTIAHKIAYLIQQKNINPDRILALTFTRYAAEEMKKRVSSLVGYKIKWIKTFHAFSLKILDAYSKKKKEIFEKICNPIKQGFEVADDNLTLTLVREILDELGWYADTSEVRSFIAYVKRSGESDYEGVIKGFCENKKERVKKMLAGKRKGEEIDDDELEEVITTNNIPEMLSKIFYEYNNILHKVYNKLDYEDLQIYAVRFLSSYEQARNIIQKRFDHILIDEYQDTDAVQYKMFKLLVGDKNKPKTFTIVGDPNQAIYSWRNAKIENILHLDKEYKDVKVIKLERNYRSTKAILEVANKVAKITSERWADKVVCLWTDKEGVNDVFIEVEFKDLDDEAEWVVEKIKQLKQDAKKLSEFAVLIRTSFLSESIERALYNANIPYIVKGSRRFYEREEIDVLLSYLRFALDHTDEVSFRKTIVFPSRRVGAKTIKHISEYYRDDWLQAIDDYLISNRYNIGLASYAEQIRNFANRIKTHSLDRAFRMLIEDIQLYDYINKRYISTADDRISAIEKMLDTLEKQNFTPESFLHFVDDMKKQDNHKKDAVIITTIHSAKGLEYDTVFVIALNEGFLPHKKSLDDDEAISEEWRVFYVAITRAKERLFLTSLKQGKMSRFLRYLLEYPST